MRGRNRRDVEGEVIDELGFRISAWNRRNDDQLSSLTIKCGLHSTVPRLSNSVVLKLQTGFETTLQYQTRHAMIALVEGWDLDGAIMASRSALNHHGDASPFLDSALYLGSTVNAPTELLTTATRHKLSRGCVFFS